MVAIVSILNKTINRTTVPTVPTTKGADIVNKKNCMFFAPQCKYKNNGQEDKYRCTGVAVVIKLKTEIDINDL